MAKDAIYSILIVLIIISIIITTVLIFTTKTSEPFTELYFMDHQNLPNKINLNQEYSFSYAIHNLENKPYTYEVLITKTIDGKQEIIKTETAYLNQDETKTFLVTFAIAEAFTTAKIQAELINKEQEIHFWLK